MTTTEDKVWKTIAVAIQEPRLGKFMQPCIADDRTLQVLPKMVVVIISARESYLEPGGKHKTEADLAVMLSGVGA